MNYFIRKEYARERIFQRENGYSNVKSRKVEVEHIRTYREALKRITELRSELNYTGTLQAIYLCSYKDNIDDFIVDQKYFKPLTYQDLQDYKIFISNVFYQNSWYINDRTDISDKGFNLYTVKKIGHRKVVETLFISFKEIAMNDEMNYRVEQRILL